uniref:Uncharacterized protein n=1 Tax=Ananas comosus var. bracteatus TaxID=296719 RepID=A0A6V7NSH0_ANACO|nr:unnamed protein product [Ananas comosus var. bracteatus]
MIHLPPRWKLLRQLLRYNILKIYQDRLNLYRKALLLDTLVAHRGWLQELGDSLIAGLGGFRLIQQGLALLRDPSLLPGFSIRVRWIPGVVLECIYARAGMPSLFLQQSLGCFGLSGAVGVDGGPRFLFLVSDCAEGTCLIELDRDTLHIRLGSSHECHSGDGRCAFALMSFVQSRRLRLLLLLILIVARASRIRAFQSSRRARGAPVTVGIGSSNAFHIMEIVGQL